VVGCHTSIPRPDNQASGAVQPKRMGQNMYDTEYYLAGDL
jgi:hypothetical protein